MSDHPKLTDHVYDGIEEHDNPIPNWFSTLFIGSLLFGVGYYFHYELGEGESIKTEYRHAVQKNEYERYERLAREGNKNAPTEPELLAVLADPKRKEEGKNIFLSKCASCHGSAGQGGIGPNLTDEYWIHGGKLTELMKTINEGVNDKGMPPWGAVLKDTEIQSAVAFIRSLRGTNPPGAKDPQGALTHL